MKLTSPACNEPLSEAEGSRIRERAKGNVGGVIVERELGPRITLTYQVEPHESVHEDNNETHDNEQKNDCRLSAIWPHVGHKIANSCKHQEDEEEKTQGEGPSIFWRRPTVRTTIGVVVHGNLCR